MKTWRTFAAGLAFAAVTAFAHPALAQSPPPLPGQAGAQPAAAAPPAGLPAATGDVWYVEQSGTPYGPMDAATVMSNITSGALVGTNVAWRQGFTGWTPLAAVPEFAGSFAAVPPMPASPPPQSAPPQSAPPQSAPSAPPQSAPPQTWAPAAAGSWFVEQNGQRAGPMVANTVMANIQSGALTGSNLAWRQGMGAWAPIATIPEFASAISAAPPPLPTVDASRTQLVGTWESGGGMAMGPMMQRLRIQLNADGTYRSRTEMCAQVGGFPICNGSNRDGRWSSQLIGANQVTIQADGAAGGGSRSNGMGGMGPMGPMGAMGGMGGMPGMGGGSGISGTWTITDANTLTNSSGMMLRRVG